MSRAAAETETELRAWIAAGDLRRAGEWLVVHHADDVLALCRAMVRDPHLAEDLTQDVFGRAFATLDRFRGEARARTWLLAIARNRCLDALREQKRDAWAGAAQDEDPDAQPDRMPLPADLLLRRDDVALALAGLAEGERALVVLRYGKGLEYDELAEAFGLREGAVRMRVSRALSKMRAALEAAEADAEGAALPEPLAAPAAAPRRARAEVPRRTEGAMASSGAPAAPAGVPAPGHPLAHYFAAAAAAPDAGALEARLRAMAAAL